MQQSEISRRGLMLVLSSPSGAGKTTISRRLLDGDDNLVMSVSVTTRPQRPGEVDGKDYIFVDLVEFNLMVNRRELLEHAKVFDHYYGTPEAEVNAALETGRDVLFDIDWQGAQQVAQKNQQDLVTVFILPPSTRELERRLKGRAQDSDEVVYRRMAKAVNEMSHYGEYDYVVVNTDVEETLAQVRSILTAERLRRGRQVGLSDFVKALSAGQ